MKTTMKLADVTGVIFSVLLLASVSVCFGGEIIEPTRTLHEPGKTWGGLTIFSEPPQLDVSLDGEKVGETPLWLREVKTGPHTIKIAHAETVVHVEKDQRLKVGLFKGSFVVSPEPKKEQPKFETKPDRQAATPHMEPSEEEEKGRDLTLWEKFVNGTLKHF